MRMTELPKTHTIVVVECKEIEEEDKVYSATENDKNKKVLSSCIVTYFKFAYYHCSAPFFIKENGKIPKIVTWRFQQILWSLLLIPCIIFRVGESRVILTSVSEWNPAQYFRVFHACAKLLFHFVLWYYLKFLSKKYLKIVDFIYKSKNLPVPEASTFTKILPFMSASLCLVLGATLGASPTGKFLNCIGGNHEDLHKLFYYWIDWGKYALFLTDVRLNCNDLPTNTSLTTTDIVLGIFSGAGTFFRQINGFYEELLLPSGMLVFWLCAKEFATRLNKLDSSASPFLTSSSKSWDTALGWYSALKELSSLIKDAYGEILLHRLILMIFDAPVSFGYNIQGSHSHNIIITPIIFLLDAILFLIAADASKQIKTFEPWISKQVELNVPDISQSRLTVLLHDLQSNAVGISASVGLTITYPLVANVSGILITYFIICVQYRDIDK